MIHHKLFTITNFKIISDYTLQITFDNGSTQMINFKPVLFGEMKGPLQNLAFFDQVAIDPIAQTLVWPNSADFDPETLCHWPDYANELSMRARRWAQVELKT